MSAAILLVEGPNDLHTIMHLLIRHGFDYRGWKRGGESLLPELKQVGGVVDLLDSIEITVKGSYDCIGFVLDADSPLASRWLAVRDRLTRVGVELPEQLAAEGIIGKWHNKIRVRIQLFRPPALRRLTLYRRPSGDGGRLQQSAQSDLHQHPLLPLRGGRR